MMRITPPVTALVLLFAALAAVTASAGVADSTRAAPPAAAGVKVGSYVLAPESPDPRAQRDTTLTIEEQAKLDEELRRERRMARIDSLHLNRHAMLALHAAPAAERRTPAEIARQARDCANLVTAVPPGDWDIFLIASGFDLLNGVAFSFQWPEDWIVRGFTQSPDLEVPFAMGELRASAARPYMIVFNCIANPEKESLVPEGVPYRNEDVVVIGRLEITAMTPGSLTIENHSNLDYGPPEVANCWNTTADIAPSARGRIDVGSGPGMRPCAGEKPPASSSRP